MTIPIYPSLHSLHFPKKLIKPTATPIHEPLETLPYFGDSTANEALLFSPPFFPPAPQPQPTYPNYTLPPANTTLPSFAPPPGSSATPNFTLFLAPLDVGLPSLPQTACAIRTYVTGDPSAAQSAQVLAEQTWLRDERGWRREWLVGRLAALTNYSVYAIQDGTRLSGPIYFTTKSGLWFFIFGLCADADAWVRMAPQRRFLASSCMDCRIARARRTRYPFPNHQITRPHTTRRICQARSRRPCSPTSPTLPRVCSPQPAAATTTRPCKHARTVRTRTAVGSAPSRYPDAASFRKINSNSNNGNNSPSCPRSRRSRRALRRGTPRWATRQDTPRCCRASRRATPQTARVLSILAFAVRTPR